MNDESLTKVLTELEKQVGKPAVSALRREAARRGVSILNLLAESVVTYADRLANPPAHTSAA